MFVVVDAEDVLLTMVCGRAEYEVRVEGCGGVGEVFYYFRPLNVQWRGQADLIKSITLYKNGEPFVEIAQNVINQGSFNWTPSLTIPAPYITPQNSFSIEIIGTVAPSATTFEPDIWAQLQMEPPNAARHEPATSRVGAAAGAE